MILLKPLNLSKWKESPPQTPGLSPGIIPDRFLHTQALGMLDRDILVTQSEEGMPIPSVKNKFQYLYNNSSVIVEIRVFLLNGDMISLFIVARQQYTFFDRI